MSTYTYDINERCVITRLTEELSQLPFSCGDTAGDMDLEEFFHTQALMFAKEKLGQTYCVINNEGEEAEIVAFFTVSNDSIKTTFIPKKAVNKIERKIPGRKHLHTYPAVLIGRLGVNRKYQGWDYFIGQQIINYIKIWFTDDDNKTGCRFLVVDAYNKEKVLSFYERNKFKFLYADEATEKKEQHIEDKNEQLNTRHMFLDLLHTEILPMPTIKH